MPGQPFDGQARGAGLFLAAEGREEGDAHVARDIDPRGRGVQGRRLDADGGGAGLAAQFATREHGGRDTQVDIGHVPIAEADRAGDWPDTKGLLHDLARVAVRRAETDRRQPPRVGLVGRRCRLRFHLARLREAGCLFLRQREAGLQIEQRGVRRGRDQAGRQR